VLNEINSKVSLIHAESGSNKRGGKNVDPDQEKSNKQENQEDTVHNLFYNCKTIDDIIDTFHDFSYDKDSGVVSCNICADDKCTFKYVDDYFDDPMPDIENVQTQAFRNLKSHLKGHIKSQVHSNKLMELENDDQMNKQLERREHKIGLTLARICYRLWVTGRPDTDFPIEVLLAQMNGTDVGNINHSEDFPPQFQRFVADEVTRRVKQFFGTRLLQTGHLPAGKVSADKATSKHRTRHFVSFVTVVPDSAQLIHAIFLSAEIVKGHTGTEKYYIF
jgi:hypothetical protein